MPTDRRERIGLVIHRCIHELNKRNHAYQQSVSKKRDSPHGRTFLQARVHTVPDRAAEAVDLQIEEVDTPVHLCHIHHHGSSALLAYGEVGQPLGVAEHRYTLRVVALAVLEM